MADPWSKFSKNVLCYQRKLTLKAYSSNSFHPFLTKLDTNDHWAYVLQRCVGIRNSTPGPQGKTLKGVNLVNITLSLKALGPLLNYMFSTCISGILTANWDAYLV